MGMKITKIFVACFALFLLSGCEPRGESKSVQEVFLIAKSRLEDVLRRSDSPKKEVVENIFRQILDLVESENAVDVSLLGETLMSLYHYASPTVKTVLYHQADACMNLGQRGSLNKNEILLLGSRIFNVLSSELETTGFRYRY